jgi:non-ribosomal peptide synthetase component F
MSITTPSYFGVIQSNQLARVLRSQGVKADSIVGIMVECSLEMVIGIMGILKAGGAYLPIDPEYPEERIRFMLEDSNTAFLLTQSHLQAKRRFDQTVIDLDNEGIYCGESTNLEVINQPRDLAYVIYTSGSTGNPKGVMIKHYSVVNRLPCTWYY